MIAHWTQVVVRTLSTLPTNSKYRLLMTSVAHGTIVFQACTICNQLSARIKIYWALLYRTNQHVYTVCYSLAFFNMKIPFVLESTIWNWLTNVRCSSTMLVNNLLNTLVQPLQLRIKNLLKNLQTFLTKIQKTFSTILTMFRNVFNNFVWQFWF